MFRLCKIDDESSYTKHSASNINNNNNNIINGKEDEAETEINRFVSSLTGNNKITSLHQKQNENSIESAAFRDESVDDFNQSNCNNATSNNNNTKKLSAFNCDTTTDKRSAFERESDSIFVQTESWKVAKTYTDAIKHRRDSTLLGKYLNRKT